MLDEVADRAALLAERPATPMFKAPYKLIFQSFWRGDFLRISSAQGSAGFCAACLGSKFSALLPSSVAEDGDISQAQFHVAHDQLGRAAGHVDLTDGAGAGDRICFFVVCVFG